MQPGASCVVVSPHLDDAVFSVWHLLTTAAEARVVTVCAGIPAPGFVTTLDRARGGAESAGVMRQRRADDRAALAGTRAEAVHLDLLDIDYRAFRRPALRAAVERTPSQFIPLVAADESVRADPRELARILSVAVPVVAGVPVYFPVSIGGHPDHRDVARAGLLLAADGHDVRLYADLPYIVRHGLPTWLGGTANPRADAAVLEAFAALERDPEAVDREIVVLDHGELAAKLAAMRRYRTEFGLVDADFGGALRNPDMMRYEVYWPLTAARAPSG